ncbi:MAG: hypothetical protein ACYC2H_06520 [Thermoplasmatota archaeon]
MVTWLDERAGLGRRWKDRTHAFEWSVGFLIQQVQRFGSLEEFEHFVREAGDLWLDGSIRTLQAADGTTATGTRSVLRAAMQKTGTDTPSKAAPSAPARSKHVKPRP